MLRIAIIGCGEHSEIAHGPPWARLAKERPADVALVGACDLNLARAEHFCRTFGFAKPYTDYEQMLQREKPDACIAVMPVHLTAGFAENLLRRKMPCVIEKPMGSSIDEVRHLAEVARQTGTPHMVSVNRRFLPHLNQAIAWIKSNGRLRFISAAMFRVHRSEPPFVWETGMHVVDALRHAAGDVADVQIISNGDAPGEHPWYAASLRFVGGAQNGTIGTLQILPTCGSSDEVYELMGEGFRAQVTAKQTGHTTLKCWKKDALEISEATAPHEEPFVFRGEYAEATEFLEALLRHRSPRPTVADVLPSAEICARLLRRASSPA